MLRRRARSPEAKANRRDALLEAARTYTLAAGTPHGLRMAHVAQAAGLSKGSVYLYFPSKEALLIALFQTALAEWVEALESTPAPPHAPAEAFVVETLLASMGQAPLAGVLLRVFFPTLDPLAHADAFEPAQAGLAALLARGQAWLAHALGTPHEAVHGLWLQMLLLLVGMAQFADERAAFFPVAPGHRPRFVPDPDVLADALHNLIAGWKARDGHALDGHALDRPGR